MNNRRRAIIILVFVLLILTVPRNVPPPDAADQGAAVTQPVVAEAAKPVLSVDWRQVKNALVDQKGTLLLTAAAALLIGLTARFKKV